MAKRKSASLAKKYDLEHVDGDCKGLVKYLQEGDNGFLRCLKCNKSTKWGPMSVVTG